MTSLTNGIEILKQDKVSPFPIYPNLSTKKGDNPMAIKLLSIGRKSPEKMGACALFISITLILLFHTIFLAPVYASNRTQTVLIFRLSGESLSGEIVCADDDGIVLWTSAAPFDSSLLEQNSETIAFADIEKVAVRIKGNFWKGALIGGLSGGFIGVSVGLLSGDDEEGFLSYSAEQKAGMLGFSLAMGGAIIGKRTVTRAYVIDGKQGAYKFYLPEIKKLARYPD